MEINFYQELNDLIEIFENAFLEEQEVICYKMIKKIVDGKVKKENISEHQKILAQKQLVESLEWLQCIGVTIKFKEELMKVIS